jgi:hypothetical protein
MYRRLQARPGNQSVPDERLAKERAVSTAFMQYLASSGVFAGFREEQAEWEILMVSGHYCYVISYLTAVISEKRSDCSLDRV